MKRAEVHPNLDCYDYYFEARCWLNDYYVDKRQKLRVVTWTMILRNPRHRKRLSESKIGAGGLKAIVSSDFAIKIEPGIMADVKSFMLIVTIFTKDGDVDGAKSILQQVWDVDSDVLSEPDEDSARLNGLHRESPLYPDEVFLWTLAHNFGANNDIPSALRVVD